MARLIKLSAKERLEVISEDFSRISKLVEGHRRLLEAIGNL